MTRYSSTDTLNAVRGHVDLVAQAKRIGNSLAVFIPAHLARRVGLREGDQVRVAIDGIQPTVLGLLQDLPYKPYARAAEDPRGDRV